MANELNNHTNEEKVKNLLGDCGFILFEDGRFFIGENNGPIRHFYGNGNSFEKAFEDAVFSLN